MAVAAPGLPRRSGALPRRRLAGARILLGAGAMPLALAGALVFVMVLVAGGVVNPGGCRPRGAGDGIPGALDTPGSLGGVAGTGLSRAQVQTVRGRPGGGTRIAAGTYATTSYGPPWGGLQGEGESTAGGIVLNGGSPRYYMVAADPAAVQLGALIYAWPNPFDWKGPFLAADVGGWIDANELDFYDWRGRETQYGWGRRSVRVSPRPIRGDTTSLPADDPAGAPAEEPAAAADFSAAIDAARATTGDPVGFAIADSDGQLVAQVGAQRPNVGRSTSKALILVALARNAAKRPLTSSERSLAAAMIQASDNAAASALYARVGGAAVDRVARAAGMTGWTRDSTDPVYTLGRSTLTAADLARLFARIDQLLPKRHRGFALKLLGNITGAGRFGLLNAGLPGTVLSKGGWSPEGAHGWTVNQAAQVKLGGSVYGVAVVLGGQESFAAGAEQIQRIGEELAAVDLETAPAGCGAATGAPQITTTGPLGNRIGQIARSHVGVTEGAGAVVSIAGFEPPSFGLAWCAWFATNVWRKAGVQIPYSAFSGYPYAWAATKGLLFKRDGQPPQGRTPPVGSVLMYGTGPENTTTSQHLNIVDTVNQDGSFMLIGGNESDSVLRTGPCTLSRAEPAYLTGPGCDARPVYGIAMPSTGNTDS